MPTFRRSLPRWWHLSAALCALTLAGVGLSYRYRTAAHWTARSERTYWGFTLVLGRLVVIYERNEMPEQPFIGTGWLFELERVPKDNEVSYSASCDPSRVHFRRAGIAVLDGNAPGFYCDLVYIPLWLPLLAFAILPAAAAYRRLLGRRRTLMGRCSQCGYDLRGGQDRCPECGTPRKNSKRG